MGLKGVYTRYGRVEARLIVMKLIVRASEPDVVQRLLGAYARLAPDARTTYRSSWERVIFGSPSEAEIALGRFVAWIG